MRRSAPATALAAVLLLCALPLAAQQAPVPQPPDSAGLDVPSPRSAALRSFLVPGWGQASFRSYVRGGFYFAARTGSWFMLLKTLGKLSEARDLESRRVAAARDSILAELPAETSLDPETLEQQIDAVPRVRDIRALIDSRKEQREDWIAWVVFWTLADAADAYVNAQLADFPAEVGLEPRADGGLELRVGWRPGRRP